MIRLLERKHSRKTTCCRGQRGFTLTEMLVATTSAALLVALLLPALQQARESSRKAACKGNLRQIGLALLQYESSMGHFPVGAQSIGNPEVWPVAMTGFSWWPSVMPYLGEQPIADGLTKEGLHPGWTVLSTRNAVVVDDYSTSAFFCNSSNTGRFYPVGAARVAMPSYAGVSGASSHDNFVESRITRCCLGSDGEMSAGGVLIANASVRIAEILDGASNTLLVGEMSAQAIDKSGRPRRIDSSFPYGWLAGTTAEGTPPAYATAYGTVPASYGVTTIRYRPNELTYELPGVGDHHGANNPLSSPHPGIVNVVRCDGSVIALSESVDLDALKEYATRDGGS